MSNSIPSANALRQPQDATMAASYLYRRHALMVRITHWINAIALTVLLMSGLTIFNAHPALNLGKSSYNGTEPVLEITAVEGSNGQPRGVTRVLGLEFDTTGVLGVSTGVDGQVSNIAFPSWLTVPSRYSLAEGRLWHFFFAWMLVINGVAYVVHALISRHLQRDLSPTRRDWRGVGQSIRDHIRFRHPQGEDAKRYNVLQKLAYLGVIFGLLPLIILTGWAMSPWLNSLLPGWVDVLGGRQTARTIHFAVAMLLVAFAAIHIFEVAISGVWNQLRSMVTGRYRITKRAGNDINNRANDPLPGAATKGQP